MYFSTYSLRNLQDNLNKKDLFVKNKQFISLVAAIAITAASMSNAIACTSMMITDLKGNAYHGRTFEFAAIFPAALTYSPAGREIISVTPDGKQAITFKTKYNMITLDTAVVPGAKQEAVGEGMNDQGLSFSATAFNNASSPPIGKDPSKILSVADLGAWVLGNFKTAAEVKAALAKNDIEFWLPPFKLFANQPLPLHYSIFDKSGGAVVVEFANNKMSVYDNPVNVLTNGPEFTWHLENLNNYTFTNVDKNTGMLGKQKLSTQDAGIALTPLPMSQTSQGRFVKAAFFVNYVRKAKTPDEAMVTLSHIMNNFDRPYDLSVDGAGGQGDGPRGSKQSSEVTDISVMADLSRGQFYFRTINNMNWTMIDINRLKGLKQMKRINMYDAGKSGADLFTLFNT